MALVPALGACGGGEDAPRADAEIPRIVAERLADQSLRIAAAPEAGAETTTGESGTATSETTTSEDGGE